MTERRLLRALFVLVTISILYSFFYSAPRDFPSDKIITLPKGASLSLLSYELERRKVIRSPLWFRVATIVFGGETSIQAGDYYLEKPEGGISLAWRMVHGDHNLTVIKVTIPEGLNNETIAKLLSEQFTFFNMDIFLAKAEEGYMFPDTYFIPINAKADTVIELFKNNFILKTANLHPSKDAIIMASIIEAEVKSEADKVLISGILWKRLKIGMALQVDPAPETYKVTGLPPKPINNPGLVSIQAALNPQNSPYLYFMSGRDGQTYYAKNLEEHLANVKKYL